MSALPAMLWMIGAACALLVIVVCVLRSHYFTDTGAPVRPVSWSVVGMHFVSLILLAMPYPIFLSIEGSLKEHTLHLYQRLGIPSAVVAVVLVGAELALMYLQARRAMKSEVEKTLRAANALHDEQ